MYVALRYVAYNVVAQTLHSVDDSFDVLGKGVQDCADLYVGTELVANWCGYRIIWHVWLLMVVPIFRRHQAHGNVLYYCAGTSN